MEFTEFFSRVTGEEAPFDYQRRLAESPLASRAIRVPTGAGKTAAAVLAWLWRRSVDPRNTPRRLVYILPMRVLTKQTYELARKWAETSGIDVKVYRLMGGEVEEEWETQPEQPAILVGTQDMLLSRMLNRGYAMSRYQWPVHFGLLNNDCLIVCDEVQLMSSGLATSVQLEAWRNTLGVIGPAYTWWMSATLNAEWLQTIDHSTDQLGVIELSDADRHHEELARRYTARKPVTLIEAKNEGQVAKLGMEKHRAGETTLVVVNTVERAQRIFLELEKRLGREDTDKPSLLLLHSRFRAHDRDEIEAGVRTRREDGPGRIIVATQVVEAGVDLSARTLITDLAPWASLVQRFGRCNRRGEYVDYPAEIVLMDVGNKVAPYTKEDLEAARERVTGLADAGPISLNATPLPDERVYTNVIRRKDLLELFDTTPDLTGGDIDVSRYIREGEETDVHVFWREFEERPSDEAARSGSHELCPVPVSALRGFDAAKFRWDALERRWVRPLSIAPGQIYLLRAGEGGYSRIGWDPRSNEPVEPLRVTEAPSPAYADDNRSNGPWRTIAEHTQNVCAELDSIVEALSLELNREALRLAALWHDRGKAHDCFQSVVRELPGYHPDTWAKSPGKWPRYSRRYFRHELASALSVLQDRDLIPEDLRSLTAYLIASHHGKVRLSIRSMPNEMPPSGVPCARGVNDGDVLPPTKLANGIEAPEVRLSLDCMQMGRSSNGQPSWAERVLVLRDDSRLGPFRLSYLEAVIRAADRRASRKEQDADA